MADRPLDPLPDEPGAPEPRTQVVYGTANTQLGDHNVQLTLQVTNAEAASQVLGAYLGQATIPPKPPPPPPVHLEADLLPRTGVHAQLDEGLDRGGFLLLTGEPGIGKSTLLKQLAVRRGGLYLDAGSRSPSRFMRQLLAELVPDEAVPTDPDLLLERIESAQQEQPRLVLVDAGHDPDALVALLATVHCAAGLVVAAPSRPQTAPPTAREWRVPPLGDEEIGVWLSQRAVTLPPGEQIRLVSRSAGNPLYLRAFLTLEPTVMPTGLPELESHLWSQCPPATQDLLALLSLTRRPLDAAEVTALLSALGRRSTTPADVLAVVRDRRGLVISADGQLSPFHPHFAMFIAQELSRHGADPPYHTVLADHALGLGDDASAGYHLLAAGDGRLNDVAEAGGMEAFAAGDWSLAQTLLEHAERRAHEVGTLADAGRVALGLANVLNNAGMVGAGSAAQRSIDAFERAGDGEGAAAARIFRSVLKVNTPENAEGVAELERVQQHFQIHPPGNVRLPAMLNLNLSYAYIHSGRFRDGMRCASQASAGFAQAGDGFGEAAALQNFAGCAAKLNLLDEAQAAAEQLLRRGEDYRQPRWCAAAHNSLTIIHRKRGDPVLAEGHARQAVGHAQTLGSVSLQALNLGALGNALRDQDRADAAEAAYQEALTLLTEAGGHWPDRTAHLQELVARLRMDAGHWDEAHRLTEAALAIQRVLGDRLRVATLTEKLCAIHAQRGEWEAAARAVAESATQYAPDFPEDSVNCWSQAAVLRAEGPDLEFSLEAVLQAAMAARATDEGAALDSNSALSLLTGLLDLGAGHFAFLLVRCVTRWAFKAGQLEILTPLVELLRDRAVRGEALAGAALAYVLVAGGPWAPADLERLAADLTRGRLHLHFHDRPDGGGVWTVGLQGSQPVVIQINVFTETPVVRAIGMALALLLDTQGTAIAENDRNFRVLNRRDFELGLMSQDDQETYLPSFTLRWDGRATCLVTTDDGSAVCVLSRHWDSLAARGRDRRGRNHVALMVDLARAMWEAWDVPREHQKQATRALMPAFLP